MSKLILFSFLLAISLNTWSQTKDCFTLAPQKTIKLNGYLDNYIQKSIQNWSKKKVPYNAFADFFSEGRPIFASGEMWGKAVRSACLFYWYTNDTELKTILDTSITYILTKEKSNGSISCSAIEEQPDSEGGDIWERKYVLLGMQAYYTLVNPDIAVLKSMCRQVDCLILQVGKKIKITDLGWSPNHIESSSILEPIMCLYNITKNKQYLDFATYIVSEGGAKGYNLIDEAFNNTPTYKMAGGIYPKAYEMMSFFEGLVEYYRVTGDEKIKTAIINLYKNIRENEITIAGSGGSDAPYNTHGEYWSNTAYEQTNPNVKKMMETCIGVTWMKFCSQVNRLTDDPIAIDMIEKYIYNALIGAQKPNGQDFSYMNYLNGIKCDPLGWGVWLKDHDHYTCCNLNGPLGLAYIPYISYMNSATGPVINLFNDSEFSFITPNKQNAKIILETDFPQSGKMKIRLEINKPELFEIKIRVPQWSGHTSILINSENEVAIPGNYSSIKRIWSANDKLEIVLDMRCRVITSPKDGKHQAILYGPIVLARDENMDNNFNENVEIISENGYVKTIKEKPFYDAVRLQFSIPTKEGNIRMIDYASCDNWNGRKICTWLPKK